MDERQRSRLAFHGLAIFVLGLVIGIPFAIAFSKGDDAHTHLWDVAHMEALLHGLLLMGLAAVGHLIVLSRSRERLAVTLLITGAYSSIVGATISAIWDVLGVKPGESAANTVAWVFFGYGTTTVTVAIVGMLWGARNGYRSTEDDGDSEPVVILLPQYGRGPRHEVVLEPAHWTNFAKNLEASPARLERPHSYDELADAVREAVEDGYRVKPVGGSFSWSPGAVTNGVMIDVSYLDRPIGVQQADGDRPATVTVEAGMTIHDMTVYAEHHGLTFATTTVIPWVEVGGAVANGCHGTGRDVATLSDLVAAMDVVGADGKLTTYERDDSDTWRALMVGLGGLGIIYSLTLECIPMYNVHLVDTVVNMPTAVQQMQELHDTNENFELFWFPFNQNALVKTWNRTDEPATEHLPGRAWDDLVQAFDDRLAGLLKDVLHVDPGLTPKLCKMMFSMMGKHDVVCPVPWAMQYQTSFAPVLDMGWAIPIDASFDNVRRAWNEAVEQVDEWANRGLYPQNMVLHARFIGNASTALLSPSAGHELGSAYIEVLTFEKTQHHAEYFAELGTKWEKLGGRPHWAKLIYHPADLAAIYGENLTKFLAVRAELDPDGVFLSDYLEEVLGLRSVGVR